MILSRISVLIVFVLSAFASAGQNGIRSSVDKNRILLGEPFTLTIESTVPAGPVISFPVIDSIPHFEMLEAPVTDSGSNVIKKIYKLTSFDSGHWVIPSFSLSKTVKTDTIPMDVVFSDFDPKQDYHDIKDILEVKPPEKKQWWWYAAGGGLLLLLLIVYLLKRKKKPVPQKAKATVDPYEEAMRQLKELEKERPAAKVYHTRLADIFRLYVYKKKGILSLQKTTGDLVLQVKELDLNKELYNRLSQALQLGDFVKFAKYIPSGDDDYNALDAVRKTIEEIQRTTITTTTNAV